METAPILIIEDDADIAGLVRLHLCDAGFEIDTARDGLSGVEKALTGDYSLVILDLMLPELDGLEVCKRVRAANRHLPILMLTAKSDELDKVPGLELGADDYLTKPFSIRELIARVRAILRRVEVSGESGSAADDLTYGELAIFPTMRKVTMSGHAIELTSMEFNLLLLFAQNPGRAYSRQELLDLVWGYRYSGYSHTVNSHINRLRTKIEADPSDPRYIRTVWGHGYRFTEKEELAT